MKKKIKEYSVNIQEPILASEPAITYGLNYEQNNYFQNIEGHLPNDLSIYRDYIFIDDLVSIISILLDKPINGTLNLSSGISYSIEDIIEVIKSNGIDLVNINYNYSKPGLRYNYVSNKKLLDLIGNYDFISLEDGIKLIIDTFKVIYK